MRYKSIYKLFSNLLFVQFFIFSFSISIIAQSNNIDDEILVYILPDSLEMPDNITEVKDIKKLKIKSKSLDNAVKKIELKSINKAFPNFKESDTTQTRKDRKAIKLPNMSRIFLFKLKKKDDVQDALNILSKEKSVLFVEKQMDAKLTSDPTYNQQWHLNNTGQTSGSNDADIDAPEAWQIFQGSTSIKIGIFDSGVALNHEDLSGKSYGDNRSSSGLEPYQSHGTHVAGIAAAKANNPYGGRGVDWNAKLDSRQIFNGYGTFLGNQTVANKIIDAANDGVQILNNSWASTSFSTTVRLAFAHAYKMNSVATVAMGNDYEYGNTTKYPAAFGQGIIAVGATTDEDERSPFSQTGNHIDVVAPGGLNDWPNRDGHDIWSTFGDNSYENIAGTSMATPIVSGIASLLKGYRSYLDNDDIENIIRISVDDKGSAGWDQYYGTGRVNARKALDLLRSPYQLTHHSAYGGSTYGSPSNIYRANIYGAQGLPDGWYWFIRYNVRKSISWSGIQYPHVWGRGVETTGWTDDQTYSMPWCDVVGNTGKYSATLETYCYKVYADSGVGSPYGGGFAPGHFIGWYPSSPSNVNFAYTILGQNSGGDFEIDGHLSSSRPVKTKIMSNYPNPFNPTTTINYQLKEPGFVSLKVFNVLGEEVAALVNENKNAGFYSLTFDADNLPSGLYIYRMTVNDYIETKKMLLTK